RTVDVWERRRGDCAGRRIRRSLIMIVFKVGVSFSIVALS
uniref:Uncharacterized protein n=1 Tax=Triticum urartu TaxID=4572 RepID=A0A8R7QPD9_TRIUA